MLLSSGVWSLMVFSQLGEAQASADDQVCLLCSIGFGLQYTINTITIIKTINICSTDRSYVYVERKKSVMLINKIILTLYDHVIQNNLSGIFYLFLDVFFACSEGIRNVKKDIFK